VFSQSWAQETASVPQDGVEYVDAVITTDPWRAVATKRIAGKVKQFDFDELTIVLDDGSDRSIPSEQVVHVTPVWSNEQAVAAHRHFMERDYSAVTASVPEVLKSGMPRWEQRLLIAELVQSAAALGNTRVAGILFLNLADSKPPAMLYADMPLCWSACEPDRQLVEQAQQWLDSQNPHAQLLGASWLLLHDQSGKASRIMTELKSSTPPSVAKLAVAQGWRLVPPPETMQRLNEWFTFRDQLLLPLQIGPTEFLADRLMRVGEPDLAIGQWMRIAATHPARYHRASQALEAAADQLRRLGRDKEMRKLESWAKQLRSE
jgi:hypothetical protein